MEKVFSVCVFCGASPSPSPLYLETAARLGKTIAEAGYRLVYGGGATGLMGAAADGALQAGGHVVGFYPNLLKGLEEEHQGLSELVHVKDMHTRKMGMFERSAAFVILPGGFGTMDETFEVITWKQLNAHRKPVILYNVNGYWDLWEQMTDRFIELGFASQNTRKYYEIVNDIESVMRHLEEEHARLHSLK